VLNSGRVFSLSSHLNSNFDYQSTSLGLRECRNGSKYYFTVKVGSKTFRVFQGDVNDFFNIQCLYMMSAVVSVGAIDHAERLVGIYDNPMKRVSFGHSHLNVNPFESSKITPKDPHIEQVSRNVKILSFGIGGSSLPTKEIVFYHKKDLIMTRSEDIFHELSRYSDSGNVLYIVDHLQRSSVSIFRHFLTRYRGFSAHRIHNLRYKRFNLFPRTVIHSHNRTPIIRRPMIQRRIHSH